MTFPKLSKRLQCAAAYVRPNAFVADVGTDHAYLPIALLLEGRIRGGVVSDIHKGPIQRATEHIWQWGAQDRLRPILCDGLVALENDHPEDILILGMGGELIADILARAPFVKQRETRLILQPMTHPEALRRYLLTEGFAIVGEELVKEEKIYQIICAEYTGQSTPVGEEDSLKLLVGESNLARRDTLTRELVSHWQTVLEKQQRGKRQAGSDASREERLLKEIGDWKHEGS